MTFLRRPRVERRLSWPTPDPAGARLSSYSRRFLPNRRPPTSSRTVARWLAHQRHRARSGPGNAYENRRQPHRFSASAWVLHQERVSEGAANSERSPSMALYALETAYAPVAWAALLNDP